MNELIYERMNELSHDRMGIIAFNSQGKTNY
jgi:hypothetical protein